MTKMLSPARLLPATGCALLCLMLVLGYARAQTSTPAAPTIDSVTPGDTQLKVAWTAPAGETGITAYDVRHIETSEDETDDTKWTVVDDAWTSGVLEYTITGLDNGTQYDVQVRAVNSNGDGTWSGTEIGTPALPAPTISSVRADDRAALVSWGEPTGIATGVRAYDVRYIETSADESVDSNWTVEEDAWEDGGGSLTYAITGLTNDTGYDVQVRAVDENDVNGAWSTTSSATPEDHGNTRADATSITTDARIWGAFDPTNDEDYFRFSVSGTADFWIYTLGDLDTVGELLDSSGNPIASDDYGAVLPNPDNFFLWRKLRSGTYYIKVTGFGSTDEPYVLRIRQFTDTTSRSNAATLSTNGFASGTIDPEDDQDYFKLVLSETTEVVIRASGFPDTVGELQRSNGTVIASNDDGYLPGGRRNFLIRESLQAGTYYVKVSSFDERSDGPYTVYATAITEPGSTIADAQVLPLGDAAGGIIDPAGDEDYFSLTLDETTYVIIGGVSQVIDISGELLDSNNLQAPVDSIHFGDVFIFQGRLDAGTYHLKVAGKDGTETGRYTVRAIREGSYTYFVNRCSNISRSSGINDPLYGCQWHLNNDDQFRNSAGQDIRVEEVWPTYTGDGINVAVVDDGMHYRHEDLTDNVLTSFNHNYDPDQTDIYNYFEDHGTAVAGLIAAKDNSLGVRGVAPEANVYGYNYLVEQSDANEADAMSRNSATTAISNNSWGPGDYGRPQHTHELWEAAVKDGVTNGYGGKGVVYVWAAGNGADDDDHSNLDEFANFYAVTAVCAVGHDDKRSSYSETGSNLWVCGPSNSRRVGQPRIATTDNGNRYRGSFGGTSAATPIVSGVVALVREANSSLTWRDVKLILAASARKSDPDNTGWEQGALKYGSTTDRYNYNHEYGFGMVDAKAAVDLAAGWTNAPELREITSESRAINLRIPDLPSSGTPTTVTTSLNVDPYVEFVEFVEVNAHFNHSNFRDLTVELVSPSGTISTLSNSAPIGGALTTEFRFGSARHLGEDPAGEWTLRVKDVLRRDSGRLQSWGLTIYGHGSIPGAPDIDTVTPGGGTLTIDWKEPTVTGATAITSYDLRYIRDDATDKSDDNWTPLTDVGTPGNLSHTITGLEGGVKYEFQIRAHNDSGHGPWSQAEADEPTTVAPSAPSITSITRGDMTLAVVWTAPADTGGGVITAYDVRYIEASTDETVESNWTVRDNAWRSGDLGYVIRNLTNTTEYDVQVRAVNRAGDGYWSETETGTPLPDDIPIQMQWDDTTPDVNEDAGSVVLRAVFTTTLDAPPAADFEFDLVITTTALRATQDDDYTPPSSSANFVASDFSQTDVNGQQRYRATRDFTVVIIDDTEDESVEDFRVTMNYLTPGLSHLQGGPQSALITIRDNEHVPVTISWEQPDITIDEDDGSVTLRAFAITTVDKRPEDGFSFDTSIYTSNGSAAQPGDYTQLDDTVTFSRNDFSRVTVNGERRYRAAKQIVVNIEDDTIDESEEDFTVTFEYSNPVPPHLQGGPAIASVKIADNDYVPVTIDWEETEVSIREDAGSVTLYARSTTTEAGMPLSDFSFDVSVTTRSGSARQNSDYTSWDATETFLHSDFSPTSVNGELRYRAEKQITIDILDDIHNEGDEVFTVRLAYSNPRLPYLQGSSATATVTIIDDENLDPTISTRNPPSTYRENGTSAVYTFRATDPQGGPITWSLEGDDRGGFTFTMDSSGQRVLAFSAPPDFENPSDSDRQNDYELTVIATDEDNQADRLSFTITVTDLNEGPEISRVGSAPGSVPENYDSSVVLARYTATDPENPTAQITQWSTSGTDGGDFVINEQGELQFRNTPDYDRPADSNRDNVYVFTVRASDGRVHGSFEETVTVTPVNEPPTITTTSSSATALRQNENVTSRLYTYRATDQEGSTVTWSVGGVDGRFFTIDERGQFSFKEDNPPDYEIPGDSGGNNVYDVTIQARDDEFNNASLPVTVMVREVNEGPEISRVGSAPGSVPENQEQMQVLARYTATDPEEGTVSRWRTSGTDGGDFVISEQGELRFRYTPDYERPADSNRDNAYVFTVQVSDGRYYGTFEETVTVTPVNEPPTITTTSSSATALRQNENQTSRLYTYRATDPEQGTITWLVGGTDGRYFAIDERGQFSFSESSPPDFEQPGDSGRDNVYDVTVQVRDDGFNTASLPVKVTVREVNEGPEVTSGQSAFTISENQDLPNAVYSGFDPEGGTVTRWTVGGRDGGDFKISQEGTLTFRNTPDYERPADSNRDNIYELQVRPYDGRYYGSFDVTVTVTPVNEPPIITTTSSSATALRQNENQTSRLYTYRATDPEGSTMTWSVGGVDGRFFTIDERGQFSFKQENPPDYEQPGDSGRDNVYEVTIQARDDGGNTASLPVTVTVREVNEGPEVTSGQSAFTISENQDLPNAFYTATDPEGGTVTRWNVGGRDGGDFTITQEGLLTFRNLPDYERPADSNRDNTYELQVRPYDGRYYGSFDVTVTVTPVNEPPTITTTSSSATALRQNENQTSRLYTYRATDPERSTVTWAAGGVDGRFFTIDERGQFSFKQENPPDFEQPGDSGRDNVYDVTVQVRDDGFNTASLPVKVTVREVNEGPEVTSGQSAFTISENQDLPNAVYSGFDPEGGTVTRWTVGGRDGGDFKISQEGTLTFRNTPDYERPADSNRDNIYELQVRPYDGRYYGSFDVTVTVTDVNEPPTITTTSSSATALQQKENQTSRLYTYRATDPEQGTITWLVGGTDGRFFTIDERGQFSFSESSPPDFEHPGDSGRDNVYDVTIQARDDGGTTASLPVTVTVANDAESVEPTIGTRRPPSTYRENGTSAVYTFRASDPQRQSITWTLEGTDRGDFTITGDSNGRGVLTFSVPPDFEDPSDSDRQNDYELTVIVSDEDGHSDRLSFTVTVTDVNEGPEVSGPSAFTIAENQGLSNAVYSATDPEGANVARWSVGGRDGGDFSITQGGTLYFRSPPDYERPADSNRDNVYELSIQPSDGRNTGSHPVTVTVTDVNEAPEIRRGSTTSFTQPENRTSRLYTYSATDPERGAITWSVGGMDGRFFTIDERGQFSFKEDSPPDFDTPEDDGRDNLYNVTIEARDLEPNTASLQVTVRVTEVNEGPVITRQGSAPGSVPENHGVNQVLATYTASDPERPTVRITSWSTAGRDGGDFVINALGQLRFRNTPDYERPADSNRDNVYEVTIRASDGRNTGTLEEVQVVTVTDVNEPPTITTTSRTAFTQQENRTSVLYTFRATDPEGGTVTWTAAGTDGRFFAIDEQGRFSFREDSPPDFDAPGDAGGDNVYNVTVQARDDVFNSATLDVVVTVTDHNENVEPTISTRRPPSTYRENGTSTIYTFRASDPQSGTTITWSLTGTDGGDFTIDRDSSGRGVLAFASPPDFESPADADRDNEYELAVVATDDEGNTDRVDFTIAVTNHNEGVEPSISTRRPPSTYRENNTSVVYTFRASDPQRGTTIRWSVTGNDGGDFTITRDSSGRGVLTFNSVPDFESPADANRDNEYELAVVAADGDGNSDRVDFTIAVTDINEGPQIRLEGAATTTVPENTADTQVLARFTATDPENPNAPIFQWSTSGRDGGDFVISELGELRFRSSPDYERPADSNRDNVYEVTIRASDGRTYGMLEDPLSVTVTEVNEAPVITTKSRTEFSLRENSTSTLYTYRATDQDNNDIIRWSVEGADGEDFAIYNGILTFRRLPDLENPVDADEDNVYEITVVAADRAGLRDTVSASITITEQPEGPVIAGRTSFTVTENYDITQVLGSYTATDAKDARTVHPQWSLSGRDSGDFVIDRDSGALTFRNTPDYDRPADGNRDNEYEVTVRGHDSRAYGNLNVTVTVTNINEEAPVVTGGNSHTVRENTTSSIYTYRATDSDLNDTIVWSVEGTDGDDFTINEEGALAFASAPDYEGPTDSDSDNVYEITVVAADGGGLRGTFEITVTVTELNEGPVVSGTATFTIDENQDLPSANYTATDPEATGGVTTSITWSVSGRDGGDFNIDRETGALTFRTPPDYERPADSNRDNEYEVTVRAYDGRNYGTFDVTVTVLAVNEGPEITGRDTFRYRENGTSALYTYRATDPEGDEYTWDLGGLDASDFEISDRGVLTFASPPNFDSPAGSGTDGNEYLMTVQARDDQGNTGELPVTITVTDQNEGATVSGRTEIAVQENRDPTLILATYTASDPEGQAITRWSLGGSDSGDFSISGDGELTFRNTPDYDRPADSNRDNEYRITVRAYDGGAYGNLDVTVTVSNQNEHDPIIRSGSRTSFNYREESTSTLYTYRATDQDKDDVITWTTAGTDGHLFEFDDRNALTFREQPDYEDPRDAGRDNEYELAVVATDSGGRFHRLDVTVAVTAVDEGPEITGTTTYTVAEGQELTGATFSARDPEDPTIGVMNWRTSGTDDGDFTMSQDGELSFRSTPDYERPADSNRDNVYLLTVQASDGRNYGSLDVTVTVTDQNESNPEVSGRDALSVRENIRSTLYTYSARDMDRNAEIMWSVRGADSDDFTIGEKGELSFSSNPDHEQPADSNRDNVYEITVVASDGQNEGTLDVTVTVTEVNEGPEISGRDTLTVSENYEAVLATYSGTDPEDASAEITRWSVTGRDGGDFTINEDGELTFRRPPDYERPADSDRDNEYEVTVRASDGKVYGIYEVAVNVEAVDEAPEFRRSSRDIFSYRENGASSLYTYRATDPEGAEVAWSVSGTDGGDFEISASGVLSFEEAPDYDDPSDDDDDNEYEVTVVATDQTGHAASLPVTVTVTDLNEGPIISGTGQFIVRENHDAVLGTYTGRDPEDPDMEITRWSVTGRDGGDFTINEDGELTFRNPPDYERPADGNRDNTYEVTVRASDGSYYGNFEVTVTVEAVNEPPDITGDEAISYQESSDRALETYRATDPEKTDITWGLSGADAGAFAISETGVLTFKNVPDYEEPADSDSDNVYEVTVEANDEDGETGRLEVTVTVTNVTD